MSLNILISPGELRATGNTQNYIKEPNNILEHAKVSQGVQQIVRQSACIWKTHKYLKAPERIKNNTEAMGCFL